MAVYSPSGWYGLSFISQGTLIHRTSLGTHCAVVSLSFCHHACLSSISPPIASVISLSSLTLVAFPGPSSPRGRRRRDSPVLGRPLQSFNSSYTVNFTLSIPCNSIQSVSSLSSSLCHPFIAICTFPVSSRYSRTSLPSFSSRTAIAPPLFFPSTIILSPFYCSHSSCVRPDASMGT